MLRHLRASYRLLQLHSVCVNCEVLHAVMYEIHSVLRVGLPCLDVFAHFFRTLLSLVFVHGVCLVLAMSHAHLYVVCAKQCNSHGYISHTSYAHTHCTHLVRATYAPRTWRVRGAYEFYNHVQVAISSPISP